MPIKQSQLNNAKIYNNRWEWASKLPTKLNIMEVGVSAGDFAEHMYDSAQPAILYLVDTWEQSDSIFQRGENNLRFREGENLDFVTKRFANKNVKILSGKSQEVLPQIILEKDQRDFDFDLIYIDAGHSYEEVSQDIENAKELINDVGVIVVNDYVYIGDPNHGPYGVIAAVNNFLNNNIDWEISGIILEDRMMCDVILRKVRQ
jgi:hypothetical protein